jgi:uncharacterized membrane protein
MTEDFWMGVAFGLVFGSFLMAIVLGAVIDRHHTGDTDS